MPTKIKRCLFVGLGGTGMRSLLNAKKLMLETYGEVPPMIGFLGIDTDGGVYTKEIDTKYGKTSLSPNEQLPIIVKRATPIYESNKDHMGWLPADNVKYLSGLKGEGAGQLRTNGRFCFIVNYQQVEQKIKEIVNRISQAQYAFNPNYTLTGGDQVEIHLSFSVCGGTGCGTFLDMVYALRRVVPLAKVVGYAVLPEVFDAMIRNEGEKAFIYQNAYGAIQDLDWLMHFSDQQGITLDYVNRVIEAKGRPFDSFYFVGNRNENGDTYLQVDQLSEMIGLAMVTAAGELSGSLSSVSDNLDQIINDGSMNILNKTAWVAGMGACEILFHAKDMRAAYAVKVKRRIISLLLSNTCGEVSSLVDNWIDKPEVHIRENGGAAHDDVIDYMLDKAPKSKLPGINNRQNAKPEVQQYLQSTAVVPKAAELDVKVQELRERVSKELKCFIHDQMNRECGVGLAEDLIQGIVRQVDIFLTEMNAELKEHQDKQPKMDAAIETTIQMLQKAASRLFGKKEAAQHEAALCKQSYQSAVNQREILRHQAAITFFNGLMGDLLIESDKVRNIRQKLEKVASECDAIIARNSNYSSSAKTFQLDLSENLLKSITYKDSDFVISDFLEGLTTNIYDFDTLDSQEVNALLEDYVINLPEAKAKEDKSIDDVIDAMSQEEFRALVSAAFKKSMPLLSEREHGLKMQRIVPPSDSFYIGVNDMSKSRFAVGSKKESEGSRVTFSSVIEGTPAVYFSNIGSKERIIIFRQFGVIPAFAMHNLETYRIKYDLSPEKYHVDANILRRMKGEEYSIVPRKNVTDDMEIWIKGFMFGLIRWDAASKRYQCQNHEKGSRLREYWVDLAQYRNEAYTAFCQELPVLRQEITDHIKKLRTEQGVTYVDDIINRGKANYYNAQDGSGVGQVMMAPDELEARGNESILELVEQEMDYIDGHF